MYSRPVASRVWAALVPTLLLLAAPAVQGRIEEVIVTAQKREQDLLDVPISIATLAGRSFTALFEGGADVRGLSTRVPGLYIESSNGRIAPRFYIRGLGNIDFDLAASQPVSVIMDDVVKENVVLKSFPLFDIQQVEVLRGPQGSLFGRNTTAGIVKFDSFKPSREPAGRVALALGTDGHVNFDGAAGGALSDSLAGRIAIFLLQRDDYIDNVYLGQRDALGAITEQAFKLALAWQATDDLEILLGAHSRDYEGTSGPFRANVLDRGSNGFNENYHREQVHYDGGGGNPQEYSNAGINLKLHYSLGSATLTSISAWEQADGYSRGDIDGGNPETGPGFIPFSSDTTDGIDELKQITQELRLSSNDAQRLFWQVGAFYFDSDLTISTDAVFNRATVNHRNDAWALFGQLDLDFAEAWTVTAGLRYSVDDKSLSASDGSVAGVDDGAVSGNLSLAWAVYDKATIWGKVATAFRGPTIQGRDVAFFGAPSVADSETIRSWELGYKSQFLNDRARLNLAAFHYVVKDMQFSAVGGSGNLIQLVNAEEAKARGFEFDLELAVSEHVELSFGYAWVDTEIHDEHLLVAPCGSGQCTVKDPLRGIDDGAGAYAQVDGNPFPNAPASTLSFTAGLRYPLAGGELFAYTDWAWQGETNIFLYESAEYRTEGQYEGGLRLGYRLSAGGLDWEAAVFARNLTDEENIQGGIDFNNNTAFDNAPRTYGVSLSGRW